MRNLLQKIVYKTSTFIALTVLVLAGLSLNLAVSSADNLSIAITPDCKTDAVIRCGASNVNSLINKYNNGDGVNSSASIKHIYSYFNITSSDINSMNGGGVQETVTSGRVDKNGNIYDASGKLIARNAITAGRQNIAGSTTKTIDGTQFYLRTPSISFLENSLSAYVVQINNRFAFAILASCGNPVIATAVTPAPKPMPPPKPSPTPSPSSSVTNNVCSGNINSIDNGGVATQGGNCSQNTTIVQASSAPPAPFGQCSELSLNVIQNNPLIVSVTAVANTGNGAELNGTSFSFGDGTTLPSGDQTTVTHTYANPGNYTITATQTFSGTPAVPSSICQAELATVSPPPLSPTVITASSSTPSSPTAPSVSPTKTLVNTGPGNLIVLFGVSSLIGLIGYRVFLHKHLQN